jgi:hypothetical protein
MFWHPFITISNEVRKQSHLHKPQKRSKGA